MSFDGRPVPLRVPPRAVSLLAYLLLHRGRPLARDVVAFDFWPDLAEPEARTKLRAHLRYLVTALPPADLPWFLADKRSVRWNPDAPAWVDVVEFERLARDAASIAQAADLYAGDLLGGHDDEWIGARRSTLREGQIGLLLQLIERSRRSGERTLTNQYAQQLLGLDPWREDAVCALIELRADGGDRAGALTTYTQFAQRLERRAWYRADGRDDADAMKTCARRPRPANAADVSTAAPSENNLPAYLTSFVGRKEELEGLQDRTARSAAGHADRPRRRGEDAIGR